MQSTMDASLDTVIHGCVMQSDALISSGFCPDATARIIISRSVITPIGRIESRLSTIGISPQSQRIIMCATCCSGVSGVQQAGLLVIKSRTCMLLSKRIGSTSKDGPNPGVGRRLARERDAYKFLAVSLQRVWSNINLLST